MIHDIIKSDGNLTFITSFAYIHTGKQADFSVTDGGQSDTLV